MAGKIKFGIAVLVAVFGMQNAFGAASNSSPFTDGTNRFEGPGGQFTIDLPADWKPMNPKVLVALIDPYATDQGAESGRVIQYGFAPEESATLTNPPYLMLEMNRVRRLPERIMDLQTDKDFFQRAIATSLKRAGVHEYKILDSSYDKVRHITRLSYTQIEPFTQSELRTIESVFYTQNGAVRAMVVCPGAEWITWSNTIETTIASVQIPERLRYKPRAAVGSASRNDLSLHLILALGIPFVSIAGWFILNRRCGEVMSDEI